MKKIVLLICALFTHLVIGSSTYPYTIMIKFMGRPEFAITVDLPSMTTAGALKESVQFKLLHERNIRIPKERLILRKEGFLRPLRDDTVLRHQTDAEGMLYIVGRIPEQIVDVALMDLD